jgi:UDP-glucose:(heptosyl)LPS alpha-1,3-glucosyltransferase
VNLGFVVHHFDASDGTGGYGVELVRRFAASHDVTLYAASVRSLVPGGVDVVRVPAAGGSAYARILSFPLAFRAVRRAHDVIHAQGWVADDADVVTTHIVLGAWREAAARAGVTSRPGERLLGGVVTRRERALVRKARLVIAPSHRAADDISRCYGRADGVRVVPHGFPAPLELPPRDAAREALGLAPGDFVALYAGDARKGFERAASALRDAPGVHLLVASRSRPHHWVARARALGVATRVHWAGGLDDIRPAYAAADVLLHPTIYDTFAMVVAEALASGVPVIVAREAGVSELIVHGDSGWVLEPGEDAAVALTALRDDPGTRARFAGRGQALAAARPWDRVAGETAAVYRDVLERSA